MRPSMARGATARSAAGGALVSTALAVSVSGAFSADLAPAGPRLKPSTIVEVAAAAMGRPAVPMPQVGQAVAGFSLNSTAPLLSRTSSMNQGVTRKPPLAKAAKPRAIDSGVNDAVPSDIDRFG